MNGKYNQSNERKKQKLIILLVSLEKSHSQSTMTQFKVHQCSPLDIIPEYRFHQTNEINA